MHVVEGRAVERAGRPAPRSPVRLGPLCAGYRSPRRSTSVPRSSRGAVWPPRNATCSTAGPGGRRPHWPTPHSCTPQSRPCPRLRRSDPGAAARERPEHGGVTVPASCGSPVPASRGPGSGLPWPCELPRVEAGDRSGRSDAGQPGVARPGRIVLHVPDRTISLSRLSGRPCPTDRLRRRRRGLTSRGSQPRCKLRLSTSLPGLRPSAVASVPEIVARLADDGPVTSMIDCADGGFLPDGVFDQLPMPSQIGAIRVGCGDVEKALPVTL